MTRNDPAHLGTYALRGVIAARSDVDRSDGFRSPSIGASTPSKNDQVPIP